MPSPDRSSDPRRAPRAAATAAALATALATALVLAACATSAPAPAARPFTIRPPAVTADQWRDLPARSVADLMVGRFPGVQVRTDGAETLVQIRGVSTLLGDGQPLVVLDGFPLPAGGRALTLINPVDVERIEVLKDAASLALYGVRGGNGVVLVTTRRAR